MEVKEFNPGDVMDRLRKKLAGMSVEDMYFCLGCSEDSTLANIFNGKTKCVTTETMYNFCMATHTPIVYMLGIVDEEPEYDFTERRLNRARYGNRIGKSIAQHFETLTECSEKTGIARDTVHDMIYNDYLPRLKTIYRFCAYTRVSPDWLLGLIDWIAPSQKCEKKG